MTWEDVLRKRFFGRRKTPDQIVDPTGSFTGKIDQIIQEAKKVEEFMTSYYLKIFGKQDPNRPMKAMSSYQYFTSTLKTLIGIKDKYNIDRGKSAFPIDRALSSINNQIPDLMNLLKTEPEFLQALKGALGQLASLSNGMVKI
tara:strand:+ start:634 stop:1062 length:429 start_codon:yes stop_codon:yes gene_type:complete